MSSAGVLRQDRPFMGGMVDVVPPDQLKPNQSPELHDLTLHQGVALERGGWDVIGQANVFGSNLAYTAGVAVLLPGQAAHDYVVMKAGKVGIATSGGRNGDAADTTMLVSTSTYYPGCQWQGEELIPVQDGESPILRFAGNLNTLTTGSGSITLVAGSSVIEGSGTSFSANWINAYIRILGNYPIPSFFRIVSVESTTRLTIAGAVPDTPLLSIAGAAFEIRRFGYVGLQAIVTDKGTISTSSSTATGKGTKWNTDPAGPSDGVGRPAYFAGGARANVDSIASYDIDPVSGYRRIASVASDTSITANVTFVGTIADDAYRVARPMPGRVICAHENRLYITGINWRRRTLFISPPGYSLEQVSNGEQSLDTDAGHATIMADQDVPGPDTPGTLNALLSLPSGMLLILSDVDAYVGWGEYPAFSTEAVADHGCFGQRAALAVDEGAWFAGREGVFEIQGNKPVNIIHDQLGNTWDDLMEDTNPTAILGMMHDHLFVYVHTDSDNKWLVWDRRARVWCGVWVTNMPTAATWLDSSRIPGVTDRLLMSHADDQLADIGSTIFHGDTPLVTTNPGRFRAVTPSNIAGSTGKLKRVRGVKVGYVLQGTGACTLDVSTALTPDATPGLESQGSLPVGNAYDLQHKRVRPVSGNLGRESREFTVMLERSASPTTVARVAVHDLELIVSDRRPRA